MHFVNIRSAFFRLKKGFWALLIFLIMLMLLTDSTLPPTDKLEKIRSFTRMIEFDYVNWSFNALFIKGTQLSLNVPHYLTIEKQQQTVLNYLNLVNEINKVEKQIEFIYAYPNSNNFMENLSKYITEQDQLRQIQNWIGPLSETIIQEQVSDTLSELGLGISGQSIPPVLYHVSPMPVALIVSPRTTIRQDVDLSLVPDLTLEKIIKLENDVEQTQNVSALVVEIGGMGLYPTMVMSTSDLPWLLDVVSHEWTHNYLTLRPLGINYYTTPEMRTINETAANIAGNEISQAILEKYYPDHLSSQQTTQQTSRTNTIPKPPVFNFRKEMHLTRITVDKMLDENKIEEAEEYMEERRQFFWNNGYYIRRLNQAYFAFHGAYADEPASAAGDDMVGPVVRAFRQQCASIGEFLFKISWISSLQELQDAIQ